MAESLARVFAAIRITSVRWRSYLPLKTQNLVLVDPAFVALRFESQLAFVGVVFVPCGFAEWPARVDRVRWTLAIGDLAHLSPPHIPSSKEPIHAGKNCLGELTWAFCTEGAPKKIVCEFINDLGVGSWPIQNASRINRLIPAMYPEEWACCGNLSENPSSSLQRAGIGLQVYLYRPNLPEGCIDIPDQCLVFLLQGHLG